MNHNTLTPASPPDGSCVMEVSVQLAPTCAPKILIADDAACIRQLTSSVLPGDGDEVNAAAAGEQVWESLHHEHFDLLGTDHEMPRLKGTKLIERIRNEGMSVPVIVASGSFLAERVRDNPGLQITAVIPKPFDLLELLATIRNVCGRRVKLPPEATRSFTYFTKARNRSANPTN